MATTPAPPPDQTPPTPPANRPGASGSLAPLPTPTQQATPAVRNAVPFTAEPFNLADRLDPLVAALDASLNNAYAIVQAVHSIRIEHRIDCATATLNDARPWLWWNSAEGERNAGRIAAAAQRDRELADLRSGTLIDGFLADAVGGLPQSERQGYLRVTGLDIAKPIHEGLIPASKRLWDWREARIEAPEDPQTAIRVPQKSAGGR